MSTLDKKRPVSAVIFDKASGLIKAVAHTVLGETEHLQSDTEGVLILDEDPIFPCRVDVAELKIVQMEEEVIITEDELLVRRQKLLAESDWTQLADSPLSDQQKAAWAVYRQKLRDLTDDKNWPDCEWPPSPV